MTKEKLFFLLLLPKMVLSVWRGATSSFWLLLRCPAFCLAHRESSAIDTGFSGPLLRCQFGTHCWWPWSFPLCLVVRSPHSAFCFLVHWSSWQWDSGVGTETKKPSVFSAALSNMQDPTSHTFSSSYQPMILYHSNIVLHILLWQRSCNLQGFPKWLGASTFNVLQFRQIY